MTSPVQLFDIVPTFLELAGIDEEHVHYGRSLVPQLNGAEGEAGRFVFAEGGYGTHEPRDLEGRCDEGFVGTACALPGMAYWPKSTQQQECLQMLIKIRYQIKNHVPRLSCSI